MTTEANRWLQNYRKNFEYLQEAAVIAEKMVRDELRGQPVSLHTIEARAKSPESVAEKIRRKGYRRPRDHVDDSIGVRVITLFDDDTQVVADRIRSSFTVDESRSIDKTSSLGSREVGYRSIHLVATITHASSMHPASLLLKRTRIEIQVRSIVSHAWAEIEHSLRYKAGVSLPAELSRRFDALAGTLELVDREFGAIERSLAEIVLDESQAIARGDTAGKSLHSVSLLATLLAIRPRMVRLGPRELPVGIEAAYGLADALIQSGVGDVANLIVKLRSPALMASLREYELLDGTFSRDSASAIVVVGCVVRLESVEVFDSIKTFVDDPYLRSAVDSVI